MAMTMESLKAEMDAMGIRYQEDASRRILAMAVKGDAGSYGLTVSLQNEGRFLQYRSMQFLACPRDHPRLAATLQALAALNYETRLLKLGWDPADGEIAAYVDVVLEDAVLTSSQFKHVTGFFLIAIDRAYASLAQTINAATEPASVEDAATPAADASDGLRRLLARAKRRAHPS